MMGDEETKPLFAHPYYPPDKGKVERTIRNVAEEFVNLLRKFLEWLTNIWKYRKWYNEHRFHRGINTPTRRDLPFLIWRGSNKSQHLSLAPTTS